MKKLITISILSISVCAGVSYWFYSLLDKYYKDDGVINLPMDYAKYGKEHDDILIIGASDILMGVNPLVIDSITGLRSYELALKAATIPYHIMLFKEYLQSHPKPGYVFLQVDWSTLTDVAISYNFPAFYRYLDDTIFYNYVASNHYQYRYSALRAYYTFQFLTGTTDDKKLSLLLKILKHSKIESQVDSTIVYTKGFMPLDLKFRPNNALLHPPLRSAVTPRAVAMLNEFITICKADSIPLIFIRPPVYSTFASTTPDHAYIDSVQYRIANERHVPVMSYIGLPRYDSTSYFFDESHLSKHGADVFSKDFAIDIKNFIAHPDSFTVKP